jgi:PilZ domain
MLQMLNGQADGFPASGERRAFLRCRPSSVAYVRVGPQNGGVVLDISENGVQLSAGEVLGSDEALPLSLQLAYRSDPIEATGQIVWLSDSRRTAGLQFVSLAEQDRTRLRDWMASEQKATATPATEAAAPQPIATAPPAIVISPSEPIEAPGGPGLAPLSSDTLFRKQSEPLPSPVIEEQPALPGDLRSDLSAQVAPQTETLLPVPPTSDQPSAPEPLRPSRWGRTDAKPAPEGSADVEWIRQLFPQHPIVDNAKPQPTPPAAEGSVSPAGGWARGKELSPLEREWEFSFDEDRRPSAFRIVVVGGLMLLCFAVGLIIGINWLARPLHTQNAIPPNPTTSENPAATATPDTDANRNPAPPPVPSRGRNTPSPRTTRPSAARPPASENPAPEETASLEATQPVPPKPSPPTPEDSLADGHGVDVTPPAEGQPAVWVRLPQIALSASGSVAISVQQSVLVPPAGATGGARSAETLVGGRVLSSSVEPLVSAAPIDPNGDVIHLRVWVDSQGEIRQIMPGDGRADLIAIAEGEVRGWAQTPARLSGKPIDSVEDVTIMFRP